MSQLTPERALIFRITHVRNVPWLLKNGVYCRNSVHLDPNYISIGNPDLIEKRRHREVLVGPGGNLADYIPFYFTPYSIMLFNIKTGYGGIKQVPNADIAILVTSLHRVQELGIRFVLTDRHAYSALADYYDSLSSLEKIDWALLNSRNFKHDPDDPLKKERYQAEALVHNHLPPNGLIGVVCNNKNIAEQLSVESKALKLDVQVVAKPDWYF